MKYLATTICSLLILLAFSACNEEDLTLAQNSYIKIIQGRGSDEPLSVQEYNGNLLIVSNSRIVERGGQATSNRVRILRVSLNGTVIDQKDKYFPENLDQDWSVKEAVVIDNQRIILGGTVGTGDSLFFLEVNAQLDSVNSQYYNSEDANEYELTGLYYDENSSKIFFGGSESITNGEEYTLFAELNASDLSIENRYRSEKALELPSTAILEDGNGGLIWAYNSTESVLMRSPNRDMKLTDEIENLNFDDASNVVSKKLMRTASGDIIILGELEQISARQRKLFFYNASSGAEAIFGEDGESQLNGAKQIEGGFLIAGSTEINGAGSGNHSDFYLSRRGINGGESFSISFGSDADEELHDAVMVNDDIYSIGSTVIGIENTLLLIKTDKFGRLVN